MAIIDVQNISFLYDEKPVLQNISIHITRGQVLCIIGPNGSGKTTFLNCILGLNTPQKGQILIDKKNIKSLSENKRAQLMSYVPQEKGHTFPFKVIDMVLMGRSPYISAFSSPKRLDREIAMDALRQVGIEHLYERIFTQLSGGERQLVILARALAQETDIIIMDEPTASLDYRNELIFLEQIVNLIKKKGISIVMATHFPNHAYYFENQEIDTKVMMLNNHQILDIGKPQEVLHIQNINDLYGVEADIITYNEYKKFIVPIQTTRR